MSARPSTAAGDALELRKEMLQLRAGAERLELLAAIDGLAARVAPWAGAARRATHAAQLLSGRDQGRAGWVLALVRTEIRHPWVTSLAAAAFSRLRGSRRRRSVGAAGIAGVGVALGLGLLWSRLRRRARARD
jgi:hypothetical protein